MVKYGIVTKDFLLETNAEATSFISADVEVNGGGGESRKNRNLWFKLKSKSTKSLFQMRTLKQTNM